MTIVNVLEAKTNLSRLIAEVETGGEVIIARNNRPVVRLVIVASGGMAEAMVPWPAQPTAPKPRRIPGRLKGLIEWDDRFNDPLPDDELRLWNGEGD
jgi:prevent-host-death family protein